MESALRIGVLFVCHANICRSPLAEGIFAHLLAQRGRRAEVDLDSAGVHAAAGFPPHPLGVEVARRHGIVLHGRSRPVAREDFGRFHHVLAMDHQNLAELERLRGLMPQDLAGHARVRLLRSLVDPAGRGTALDVPDPVTGGIEGYERAFEILRAGCEALLSELG
jgi:protein-tyrosine phosphatase